MSTTLRFRSLDNVDLIRCIKLRRALWDKDLWNRIDTSAREIIWDDVAEQMKTTKEVVKTRWKNLRDSYRKLLIRAMNNPCEEGIIKWKYFHDMAFIKEIVLNTRSKVNDISVQNVGILDNDSHEDPLLLNNDIDVDDIKVERSAIKKIVSSDIETSSPGLDSDIDFNSTEVPNEKLNSNYPNDDDLQFLLSLYPHFKQVPMSNKLLLRIKIEKLIYEQLYGNDNSVGADAN